MQNRYLALCLYGDLLTFTSAFIAFYFSEHLTPADEMWHISECVVVVLVTVAVYFGYPRDLPKPLPISVCVGALLLMVASGGVWAWLIVRTVFATPDEVWPVRIERTLALLIFAAGYYLFCQKRNQ